MIMKTTQTTIDRFNKPNLHDAYNKAVRVIMKCRTEEQLEAAGRYLRNYERLMQNSYLYPSISKPFKVRTVSNLLSLLRIKRKAFLDL
jgi:hypothetical protein